MPTLDCTVDGLGGHWLPAVLTTDHSTSSYGQPTLLLDGQPLSPLDLIEALRPAARTSEHPERFAVMVRIEGSGPPVYYHWRDVYSVTPHRLGDYDPDGPYQQAVRSSAEALRQDAAHNPTLADLTAAAVLAIGASHGPAPRPVEARQVAHAPEDYIAFRLTEEEWALTRAARAIGFLVHPVSFDAIDLIDPASVIRAARYHLGISQADLGAALDVSPNTIARWERGELRPEHPRMLCLALRTLPEIHNRMIE